MESLETRPQQRQRPRQARSRATVARILENSAVLLDEVGLEGFNTNLLAERASVGMQAIYRYFPNKTSILAALLEDAREAERDWIGDLSRIGRVEDWRGAVRDAILRYHDGASHQPGFTALRNAVRASPEMQAADRELSYSLEQELAEGLHQLGVQLDASRMAMVCRTVMEAATRLLDVALDSSGPEAEIAVEELIAMITSYLERYVPDATGREVTA